MQDIRNSKGLKEKILLMKEIIIDKEFHLRENYLIQFDDEIWEKEVNYFRKLIAYKAATTKENCKKFNNNTYMDADCDVSLASVIVYCIMYYLQGFENFISLQFGSHKKYEISIPNYSMRFRGDTLTPAIYLIKRYLGCLWKEICSSDEMKENERYGKFYNIFFEIAPDHEVLKAPNDDWFKYNYDNADIIWNAMGKEAQDFLFNWLTTGNFIAMPIYINPSRSSLNGKREDTVDTLLWNIYKFYYFYESEGAFSAKQHVENIMSGKYKEKAVENFIKWMEMHMTWNEFINMYCLQDFVEVLGDGKYGRPISMKTGQLIDCQIKENYYAKPNTLKQYESFFRNVNKKIQLRSERIFNIIDKNKKKLRN